MSVNESVDADTNAVYVVLRRCGHTENIRVLGRVDYASHARTDCKRCRALLSPPRSSGPAPLGRVGQRGRQREYDAGAGVDEDGDGARDGGRSRFSSDYY